MGTKQYSVPASVPAIISSLDASRETGWRLTDLAVAAINEAYNAPSREKWNRLYEIELLVQEKIRWFPASMTREYATKVLGMSQKTEDELDLALRVYAVRSMRKTDQKTKGGVSQYIKHVGWSVCRPLVRSLEAVGVALATTRNEMEGYQATDEDFNEISLKLEQAGL